MNELTTVRRLAIQSVVRMSSPSDRHPARRMDKPAWTGLRRFVGSPSNSSPGQVGLDRITTSRRTPVQSVVRISGASDCDPARRRDKWVRTSLRRSVGSTSGAFSRFVGLDKLTANRRIAIQTVGGISRPSAGFLRRSGGSSVFGSSCGTLSRRWLSMHPYSVVRSSSCKESRETLYRKECA